MREEADSLTSLLQMHARVPLGLSAPIQALGAAYARPEEGGIVLSAGPAEFAEFFPPLTEEEAIAAIGPYEPGGAPHLVGTELDARLDQIEAFLRSLPRPGGDDDAG